MAMATLPGTHLVPFSSLRYIDCSPFGHFEVHRKSNWGVASDTYIAPDLRSSSWRHSKVVDNRCRKGRRLVFRISASSLQDNHPIQTKNSLKTLVLAYKAAFLNGDHKALHELEDEIIMLEKEKNELFQKSSVLSTEIPAEKEKCIRLQADFDNYRKRIEKESLGVRNDAQAEVIERLLPLIDSFERARLQIKVETEMEKKIDTSYQGIYKQFVEIMRSLKVSAIPTVGKPFDPLRHEAIARVESVQFKEGIISQEVRRGFLLGERLLRPAMVKVSSGSGKRKPAPVPEKPASVP